MKQQLYNFEFSVYASTGELESADAELVIKARLVTAQAYAPYSNFKVAAAARLTNNEIVTGTNQENASYPAGICAERVLLSAAASLYPGVAVTTMAISYNNGNGESVRPVSPCGICRQSLLEHEMRFQQNIRLLLSGMEGEIYVIEKAAHLLPLSFTNLDL